MANWPPQITVRSHRRDWWKKYHPEGNLYVVIVAYHEFSYIVSCWHSRVNTTWGTSAVPTARPPLHPGSNSHHKIRCWHAACLMEKAYLCWYRCPPFLSDLRSLYVNTSWVGTYICHDHKCLALLKLHGISCQKLCRTALVYTGWSWLTVGPASYAGATDSHGLISQRPQLHNV